MRKASQRICSKAGIAPAQNSKPGKHLPHNHPLLEKVRGFVRTLRDSKQIHPLLVGNYDQVWSLQYRPSRATLQRKEHADTFARHMSLRKLRHKIELALDLDVTENVESNRYRHRAKAAPTGGQAASAVVDGWRIPRTITTLSWIDGTISRGYVTIRADGLSEEDRRQANQDRTCLAKKRQQAFQVLCRSHNMNRLYSIGLSLPDLEELSQWLEVAPFHNRSHIWNAETMVKYLGFLAGELRARRQTKQAKIYVLCF